MSQVQLEELVAECVMCSLACDLPLLLVRLRRLCIKGMQKRQSRLWLATSIILRVPVIHDLDGVRAAT